MKKGLILLTGLLILSSKPTFAACSAKSGTPAVCSANTTECFSGANAGQCCDSPTECCDGTNKMPTAIGCIAIDPSAAVRQFLTLAIGIGGGIAFILMLFGSFQIMASGGDPKSIQAGKELITATLTGLLLIIFSVFILKLVGVDILGIPGLQKPTP